MLHIWYKNGGHLEIQGGQHLYIVDFNVVGCIDILTVLLDTKHVFIRLLQIKSLYFSIFLAAILFLASKKNPQWCHCGIRQILTQEGPQTRNMQ